MKHYQQPGRSGCTYYSFASLAQDPWFLQFAEDLGSERLWIRAWRRGWLLFPIYSVDCYISRPAPEDVWRGLHGDIADGKMWHLHVAVKSLRYYGVHHHVGVVVQGDGVWVTDPSQSDFLWYSVEDFLRSHYARTAFEIMAVYPNKVAAHEVVRDDVSHEFKPLKEPVDPMALAPAD